MILDVYNRWTGIRNGTCVTGTALNYLACVSLWLLSLRRGFLIKYRVTQMPLYVEVWLCNNKAPDDEMS